MQNGGTVNLSLSGTDYATWGGPALQLGSPPVVAFDYANLTSYGQGEYHLNGGTLITGVIGGPGNAGTDARGGQFYFNGGTLVPTTSDLTNVSAIAGAGQNYFMQGLTEVVVRRRRGSSTPTGTASRLIRTWSTT